MQLTINTYNTNTIINRFGDREISNQGFQLLKDRDDITMILASKEYGHMYSQGFCIKRDIAKDSKF